MIEDEFAHCLEDLLDFTRAVAMFGNDPGLVRQAKWLHEEYADHEPSLKIGACPGCAPIKANLP